MDLVMDKEQELSLLQITAQYVADVQAGQQPSLSDYLASYPHYADAIADFVAYYHLVEEVIPSMDAMPKGYTVNRVSAADSMTTLLKTATGQQLTLSQLAAELDLSIDIVLLLEQRAIAPATIPYVLFKQIALLLRQPDAAVQEYLGALDLRQSRSVVSERKQQTKVAEENTDYIVSHAEDKPSFRAVVETSLQLSVEQRNRWSAVLDSQKPHA
jgi:hypothetical protein